MTDLAKTTLELDALPPPSATHEGQAVLTGVLTGLHEVIRWRLASRPVAPSCSP